MQHRVRCEGEAAFPNECCGILYGTVDLADGKVVRVVDEIQLVENAVESTEKFHRFSIAPRTLMAAEKKCTGRRVVLGFYHSHPNHPARPSEYDRSHAWPFYSYVIVAVESGIAADFTSWMLDEQTGHFVEQAIEPATAF